MRIRSAVPLLGLSLVSLAGCQAAGGGVAGKYNMSGGEAVFGEGADKTVLELKDDKTFSIDLGPVNMAKGTWSSDGSLVSLDGGGSFGVKYRIDGSKLIPQKPDGGEVTAWSFSK